MDKAERTVEVTLLDETGHEDVRDSEASDIGAPMKGIMYGKRKSDCLPTVRDLHLLIHDHA